MRKIVLFLLAIAVLSDTGCKRLFHKKHKKNAGNAAAATPAATPVPTSTPAATPAPSPAGGQ